MSNWKLIVDENNKPCWYTLSVQEMERYNLHYIENYEWEDKLLCCGYERGTSSCVMLFRSEITFLTYQVFMSDFTNTIVNEMVHGTVEGTFTFTKRGTNYGIKLVKKC